MPEGCTSLAQPVQVVLLTTLGICCAALFDFLLVIPPFHPGGFAIPTIQSSSEADFLELPEKMSVGPTVAIRENPRRLVYRLPVRLQEVDDFLIDLHVALLVVLGG